jgi:hypothetical protein
MKFPKVSGKVIAAILFILIILYSFRRESYEVDRDRLKGILDADTTLTNPEKERIGVSILKSTVPGIPVELKSILDKRPMLRNNLAIFLDEYKQQVKPPAIQDMVSKYNGFECMLKPPSGFECRAK